MKGKKIYSRSVFLDEQIWNLEELYRFTVSVCVILQKVATCGRFGKPIDQDSVGSPLGAG